MRGPFRFANRLAERVLKPVDRGPLMVYCQAWAAWLGAIQYIEQYGSVIKTPNGHLQQSPYVSIANNNAEVVLRIAQQFGFTPGSRGRIWMVGSAPDSGRLELEENGLAPWG
jgi:P27 family predicted phage terminase small subunit